MRWIKKKVLIAAATLGVLGLTAAGVPGWADEAAVGAEIETGIFQADISNPGVSVTERVQQTRLGGSAGIAGDISPGDVVGTSLILRSSDDSTVTGLLPADAITFDYEGDPADFSWQLRRNYGSCNQARWDTPWEDRAYGVYSYGESLSDLQIRVTPIPPNVESIDGEYTFRQHLCLLLKANDSITPNQNNGLTVSLSPSSTGSNGVGWVWSVTAYGTLSS